MKFLIFIPPNDFKDETLATTKMFFDKWGIAYDVTSYSTKDCTGVHGAVQKLSVNTNKADPYQYDGVLFVDGPGVETYKLQEFRPLLDLTLKLNNAHKYILAIGNAQKIIARANVIKGKKIAAPDDQETKRIVQIFHGTLSNSQAEVDDNIVTARDSKALEDSMNTILEHFGIR